jgi:hypothetical protein
MKAWPRGGIVPPRRSPGNGIKVNSQVGFRLDSSAANRRLGTDGDRGGEVLDIFFVLDQSSRVRGFSRLAVSSGCRQWQRPGG